MQTSVEYLIISASLRLMSRSRVMANYLADCYRREAISPRVINLRDVPLPLCDGESAYGHPDLPNLAKVISEARVIVVATPIYNFDVSAALKNLVELTGRSWENKIVGFLCAAGGSLSYMSVMSLASSLMLDFRCLIIPRFVFATGQDFKDGELTSFQVLDRIHQFAAASIRIRND
jgi:NAD(P)H-dependent FMN reductase